MRKRILIGFGVAAMVCIGATTIVTAEESKEEEQAEEQQEEAKITLPVEIETDIPIEKGARIAVVTKNTSGSYWDRLKQGMEDAVAYLNEAYGLEKDEKITMTFEGPNDEQDVTNQINILDAVLAENPAVLCLSAADMESCQAQLETARENGIPVIMFDSYVKSDLYGAFCGSDNEGSASMAAEKMAEAMGESGQILILAHQSKTQTSVQRAESFQKKLKEYPEMSVAETFYWDEQEDMKGTVQTYLEEHPDIQGVFCTNGDMGDLFLEILDDFSDRELVFAGFDATKNQKAAVAEGKELGLVGQQPYAIGFQTIYLAVKATGKEKLDSPTQEILLDTAWITQENIEDPAYSQYLDS